jgi:serine/threonine protein kinase
VLQRCVYSSVKSHAVLGEGALRQTMQDVMQTQCLSFLCHVWCRGVVHRDLKLENLLLATPNDIHKVKIADFGLAKKAAESAMATICGTPQYVAPEVIQVRILNPEQTVNPFSLLMQSKLFLLFFIELFNQLSISRID